MRVAVIIQLQVEIALGRIRIAFAGTKMQNIWTANRAGTIKNCISRKDSWEDHWKRDIRLKNSISVCIEGSWSIKNNLKIGGQGNLHR